MTNGWRAAGKEVEKWKQWWEGGNAKAEVGGQGKMQMKQA